MQLQGATASSTISYQVRVLALVRESESEPLDEAGLWEYECCVSVRADIQVAPYLVSDDGVKQTVASEETASRWRAVNVQLLSIDDSGSTTKSHLSSAGAANFDGLSANIA
ncbi:hypothetical protein CCMA1212_000330 [Trichoderma ghanense]|uniref:Uncharacterized protein n=1 Tax=Trichoderma ghanense TaxID=65468 RepID=A0ABY2HIM5_9HYPO